MATNRQWIEITPESVAISSLENCHKRLEEAAEKPDSIFHAAADANRAIQAALTAALAGSANIGASPPKERGEWLQWFEESRESRPSKTPSWRVMGLRDMLIEAMQRPLPWTSLPLELCAHESFWIGRLLFYRDSFEHPKQLTFLMTRSEIADSIEGSVAVVEKALRTISHQIYDELAGIGFLVSEIRRLARSYSEMD
jgi:hypothetical protein